MYLDKLTIKNHPYLGDQNLDFINHKTGKPFSVVAFVGENASGKTSMLEVLFNYSSSEYVVERNQKYGLFGAGDYQALFIRQNSIHSQAEAEIRKSLDGADINPLISCNNDSNQPNSLRQACAINNPNEAAEIINRFNDPTIASIYNDKKFLGLTCSGETLEKINGKKSTVDISKLSSGQQELVIKIASLGKILTSVDYVLFDEPETSLHPRWQRTIVKNLRDMLENNGEYPQIFLSTHSEKILESLIGKDDVKIFKFAKEGGKVHIEDLESMPLCLPQPTFSEINYIVFNIPSYDYHNQLIARLQYLSHKEGILGFDNWLCKKIKDKSLFREWVNQKHKDDSYKTLPVYIRNYYHHPIAGVEVTEKDLNKSINFLRAQIKHIVDNKNNDIM